MANNTVGEKELRRDWPVVTGLEAIDKHEGRQTNLVPTIGSLIPRRRMIGIDY